MKEINFTEEMITAFHCGSLPAFHELYTAHAGPLYQFTWQLTQHKPEAGYIVLDTFMKLLNRRTHFYNVPDIRAFLYITARNTALDYLRSAKTKPVDAENDPEWLYITEEQDCPDEETISVANNVLQAAIASMPPLQQAVICLVFEQGMPVASVAKQLNITTAEVFINRKIVIRHLQRALQENYIPSDCLLAHFLAIGCREVAQPVHIPVCKG